MPVVHRRVRQRWPRRALAGFCVTCLLLLIASAAQSLILLMVSVAFGGLFLLSVLLDLRIGARWEYTVEGRTLSMRRPSDRGRAIIQLDEVTNVYCLEDPHDVEQKIEFVFRSGQRVSIEAKVVGSIREFSDVLRTVRPDLAVAKRDSNICPACRHQQFARYSRQCEVAAAPAASYQSRRYSSS